MSIRLGTALLAAGALAMLAFPSPGWAGGKFFPKYTYACQPSEDGVHAAAIPVGGDGFDCSKIEDAVEKATLNKYVDGTGPIPVAVGDGVEVAVTFEEDGSVSWGPSTPGGFMGLPDGGSLVIVPQAEDSHYACPYIFNNTSEAEPMGLEIPGDTMLQVIKKLKYSENEYPLSTKKVTVCSVSACPDPSSSIMRRLCGTSGLGVSVAGSGKICPCETSTFCDSTHATATEDDDCPAGAANQPTEIGNAVVSEHGSAPCQAQLCNFKLGGTSGCKTLVAVTSPPCP